MAYLRHCRRGDCIGGIVQYTLVGTQGVELRVEQSILSADTGCVARVRFGRRRLAGSAGRIDGLRRKHRSLYFTHQRVPRLLFELVVCLVDHDWSVCRTLRQWHGDVETANRYSCCALDAYRALVRRSLQLLCCRAGNRPVDHVCDGRCRHVVCH